MRIVAPAGDVRRLVLYYFLSFFTLDGGAVVQRCQRSTTKGLTADNSQALQRISHDNLQNSNARRCTTFAVASVVVVQR
tara:strand:- start:1010 stop:1246 length:237 start_codon:yes stop_codon:yes gene_type:complete